MTIGIQAEAHSLTDEQQVEINSLANRAIGAIEDLLSAYNPDGVLAEALIQDWVNEIEDALMDATWEIEDLIAATIEATDA